MVRTFAVLGLLAATTSAASAAPPARGDAVPEAGTVSPSQVVQLRVSAGKLIRLRAPATTVFVADTAIADVQTPSPTDIFVFGKKPGRTTLYVLGAGNAPIMAAVVDVRFGDENLQAATRAQAGNLPVGIAANPAGATLSGEVPNAAAAERLQSAASRFLAPGETVLNQLRITSSPQVNLRVRVAEVSRTLSRTLGFNWNTIFSTGSFAFGLQTNFPAAASAASGSALSNIFGTVTSKHANGTTVLDAMAEEGLVTMLAEPNLTAISGESATFLAGGEFPVPVPQALGVTSVEFRQYGVSVAFTPTVLGSGQISMRVRPEVSSLSTQGSINLNNITVPALVTRRADTTVELASGQSFAIAGLIQNNSSNNVAKVPWLGDIPVLGTLFRSNQFQRNLTELVIVVTPYVVRPPDPRRTPSDAVALIQAPSDLERLLFSRVAKSGAARDDPTQVPRLRGPSGFLFQ